MKKHEETASVLNFVRYGGLEDDFPLIAVVCCLSVCFFVVGHWSVTFRAWPRKLPRRPAAWHGDRLLSGRPELKGLLRSHCTAGRGNLRYEDYIKCRSLSLYISVSKLVWVGAREV